MSPGNVSLTSKSRRNLGSPFKSPENSISQTHHNIFDSDTGDSSPTPTRGNYKNSTKRKQRLPKNESIDTEHDDNEDTHELSPPTIPPKDDDLQGPNGRNLAKKALNRTKDRGSSVSERETTAITETPSTTLTNTTEDEANVNCPICNEPMVNLYQLNRHIDDIHSEGKEGRNSFADTEMGPKLSSISDGHGSLGKIFNNEFISSDIKKWFSNKSVEREVDYLSPSKRKIIKMDLLDDDRGFSLSDSSNGDVFREPSPGINSNLQNSASPPPKFKNRLSRSHWKHPSTTTSCSIRGCGKTLNVKNGVVNCRKCGLLYCYAHTNNRVRLKNSEIEGSPPVYDFGKDGIWCKCCETCYNNKPDLLEGTQANSRDLTGSFSKKRQELLDDKQLNRTKVQKRFIKLTNLLAEKSLLNKPENTNSIWNTISNNLAANKGELEREKIGYDNWQNDKDVTNCTICFVKFNVIIRKHHCRLCGKIVCDDPYGARKSCSIVVPLPKLMEKLSNLNYSRTVKENYDKIINNESLRFRCCVDCKNALLYDWKLESSKASGQNEELIFVIYNAILAQKHQIESLLPKYAKIVESTDESDETYTNRLRVKLMSFLKDFENLTIQFRNKFFVVHNNKLTVAEKFVADSRLITNIYQSSIMFLQENILWYKQLNDRHKEIEQERLEKSKKEKAAETPEPPRLTKKQIRELREELMVMNEQKFIVENLIQDYTKSRRFEELSSLQENKQELDKTIESLEAELGDFGF
ncbi:FYVE zinc finger-domain-containing protein [Scheffersomyces xylosifermentans]|uniref:FYVE zinc finger-domain-containing protein n=1 Tax=Scheffersomyces xylosifermentans TaxID=1304137 RepID=UPI00315CCDEE